MGLAEGKKKDPLPLPHQALQGELCRERENAEREVSECIHMVQTRVSLSINSICFWSDLALIRYRKLH